MKILHTSDWHIGRMLYGRTRYDEFSMFLNWLAEFIENHSIDILVIAGDIFDTTTPSHRAQQLYYRFLHRICTSSDRHVAVTGGNHDSPSFLDAPKQLLQALNVHVTGCMPENPEDEVIVIRDRTGQAKAVICAVPFLRDRDIRTAGPGETARDKDLKLIRGIRKHYELIAEIAKKKLEEHGEIPVVGMGHLFAAGGSTTDGDGVRELYVGSLAHVGADIFPGIFDYVALGHLHSAQKVAQKNHIRYSGSPLPMGFGEADQTKKLIIVEFNNRTPEISEQDIPCFQELKKIKGNMEQIIDAITYLKHRNSRAWLEIEFTGTMSASLLRAGIDRAVEGSDMEIRRIKKSQTTGQIILKKDLTEVLADLEEKDVFTRLLDSHNIPEQDRPALVMAHEQILTELRQRDINAQ